MPDTRSAHPTGQQPHTPHPAHGPEHDARVRAGLLYALAAYGWWGLAAFYFRAVGHVSPFEVMAHRVVWVVVLLAGLLAATRRLGEVATVVRSPRILRTLAISCVLIAVNWLCFIYAIDTGRLLHASLGYFINPLVSVFLGMIFLGERLRPLQWIAVACAAAGVTVQTFVVGELPWIALAVASSFGLYGLVRKQAVVGPITGLFTEAALLFPFTIAFLALVETGVLRLDRAEDGLAFLHAGPGTAALLVCAGVVTAAPLIWFVAAAKRLKLGTIGFMQYIAPTLQFLVAVLAFKEPFRPMQAVVFGLIWVGIAVFVADSVRDRRSTRDARREARRATVRPEAT